MGRKKPKKAVKPRGRGAGEAIPKAVLGIVPGPILVGEPGSEVERDYIDMHDPSGPTVHCRTCGRLLARQIETRGPLINDLVQCSCGTRVRLSDVMRQLRSAGL